MLLERKCQSIVFPFFVAADFHFDTEFSLNFEGFRNVSCN